MDRSKLCQECRHLPNGKVEVAKPAEVIKAKKIVERWNKAEAKRNCAATKRNEALIRKAREAVYFASEEKALAIIQQVEKYLKTCES